MKKQVKLDKTNYYGITLISLIITVVVLLILASVTINLGIRTGIIGTSKEAVSQTRKTQAEEIINLKLLEIQTYHKGKATLQDVLDELGKQEETEIDVIEVHAGSSGVSVGKIEEIVVVVNRYNEFEFTIGEQLTITKINGISKDLWDGEINNKPEGETKAKITIEVTPENQTETYKPEQTIEIKATSTNIWTNWEGKYAWTRNNETLPTEEELKSLTLTEGETKLQKQASVTEIGKEEGDYYLWVKITTSGQTETKSFGPYKMGEVPTEEDLVCKLNSNEERTAGTVTVGILKEFPGWTCKYIKNNEEEKTLEEGMLTTDIPVVQNDEIIVIYEKEGYIPLTTTLKITELKQAYTLIYNANGGEGGPGVVTKYDDKTFTISSIIPTINEEEKTFDSWNLKQDGTGEASYVEGNTITIEEGTTLTIYAKWKQLEIIGSITTNKQKLTEGTTITLSGSSNYNISKVEVLLGNIKIYEENVEDKKEYNKTLNIKDETAADSNLKEMTMDKLEFLGTYTPKIRITSEGKSKTITGTSNITNYTIGNKEGLKLLASKVNSVPTTSFRGETILQVATIDLKSETWTPIGTASNPFSGTYNGGNYLVKGIKVNHSNSVDAGFFGYILGTASTQAKIKNVKVYGEVKGPSVVGGIVGRMNYASIENCYNYATVTSTSYYKTSEIITKGSEVGGIAGRLGTEGYNSIINCENNGTITGNYECVGGIVGRYSNGYNGKIAGCTNNGDVIGGSESYRTGGIVGSGLTDAENTTLTAISIENCRNMAMVKSSSGRVGGILGSSFDAKKVSDCINEGTVSGKEETAGIVGAIGSQENTELANNINKGPVTAEGSYCAGIVGSIMKGTITNCINEGAITGRMYTGGIVGQLGYVYDNTNTIYSATISECKNTETGVINGGSYVGGIAGSTRANCTANKLCNYGNVTSNGSYNGCWAYTGGIAGFLGSSMTLEYCYNVGNVTSSYRGVGGIVGVEEINDTSNGSRKVQYCYNIGDITNNNDGEFYGRTGGIVGAQGKYGIVTNSWYLNNCVKRGIADASSTGISKTEGEIKALTWSNFTINPSKNSGYPILTWENK